MSYIIYKIFKFQILNAIIVDNIKEKILFLDLGGIICLINSTHYTLYSLHQAHIFSEDDPVQIYQQLFEVQDQL